jgi:DNA-binding LytR/AlgR family response regulator
LVSFEEMLPNQQFIRIHKSFIVNKKFVHYLEGNQLRMQNGTSLTLGRNHRQTVKQLITSDHP